MRCAHLKPYLLFALATIPALPTVAHGQRLAISPASSVAESGRAISAPAAVIPAEALQTIRDSTVYRSSYWQAGMVAGGAFGVIFGAMLAAGFCSMSELSDQNCTIAAVKGGFLVGATGATVGALVGGIFSKPRPPT